MTKKLRVVSYLAPNWFWFYEAIVHYLDRTFSIEAQILQSQYDPLDDPALQHDQVDLAFICGLPFIRYHYQVPHQLQALVAPVMRSPRYQNRAVYFSDVIVHADSDITTFDDLAGKTFCYNDLGSNSGYNLLRDRLIQGHYPAHFFSNVIQSGSHQCSIQWIASGKADCAAIDSTVLDRELQAHPDLTQQVRVVEAIGPCPMPPIVVAQRLGTEFIEQLRSALLHPDQDLQAVMEQAGVQRFASVRSEDYEAIAEMYNVALKLGYELIEGVNRSVS